MTRAIKLLAAVSLVAALPGCTALSAGAAIMDAGANVATVLGERAERKHRPLGLLPSDFADLRLGMTEANMRIAVGDPITSTVTPQGWVCHTLGPVLREGGSRSEPADYTDYWKVLLVDRGNGSVVAGWAGAGESDTRPNCEGV